MSCSSGRLVGGGKPRKIVRATEIASEPHVVELLPCGVNHILPPAAAPSLVTVEAELPALSSPPPLALPVFEKAASGSDGRGGASCASACVETYACERVCVCVYVRGREKKRGEGGKGGF